MNIEQRMSIHFVSKQITGHGLPGFALLRRGKLVTLLLALVTVHGLPVTSSSAQTPSLINYQGRLVDGTNLVNGSVGLSLRLFNAPAGGTLLYEDSNTVSVVDGLYATHLGDDTTAGSLAAALDATNVWLEVAVDDVALTPRERLASAAYALVADTAAAITGPIGDNQLSANIARLDGTNQTFTGPVTFSSVSNQFTGRFDGDGNSITNLRLSSIMSTRPIVIAWGQNNVSQSTVPETVGEVVAIDAGQSHSLALRTDGTVVAWGSNASGQSTVPTNATGVVAIAAGFNFSLALRADGTVVAWGNNEHGQTDVPSGMTGVVAIAAGGNHALALLGDETVVAWGWNLNGQASVPVGLTGVVAVAAGFSHSMVLRRDGAVIGWGSSIYGEGLVPANVSNAVAIAAGTYHNLVLRDDGTVVAWGFNNFLQTNVPAQATGVVAIAGGDAFSMALRDDGSVMLWGYSGTANNLANIPVTATDVVAIAAGHFHALALKGKVTRAPIARLDIDNHFSGTVTAQAFAGSGAGLTNLSASALNGLISETILPTNVALLNSGLYPDERLSPDIARLTGVAQTFVGSVMFNDASGTFSGDGAGLINLSASALASGTLPDARLSSVIPRLNAAQTFSSSVVFSNASGSFSGSGAGLTNLSATALASGTLADARLSTNIARLNATQTFSARQNVVTAPGTRAVEVLGDRTGNFNNSVVYLENTNRASSAPTLRVVGWGTNASDDGVLNVSANGAGRIARFGNSNNWVVVIDNAGNVSGLSFTPSSDRNLKENIAPVDPADILEKVAALPISRWNYRADTETPHIGPMAQDFHAAFGVGPDNTRIATVDADGVALAAIQALAKEKERMDVKVSELEKENRVLREELDAIKRKLGI